MVPVATHEKLCLPVSVAFFNPLQLSLCWTLFYECFSIWTGIYQIYEVLSCLLKMEVLYWVSESKPFHFLDVGINSPHDQPYLSNYFRSENLIRNQEETDKDDITFFSRLPPYLHASHFVISSHLPCMYYNLPVKCVKEDPWPAL